MDGDHTHADRVHAVLVHDAHAADHERATVCVCAVRDGGVLDDRGDAHCCHGHVAHCTVSAVWYTAVDADV